MLVTLTLLIWPRCFCGAQLFDSAEVGSSTTTQTYLPSRSQPRRKEVICSGGAAEEEPPSRSASGAARRSRPDRRDDN
eukprot:2534220-Prymnesium_polylepis.1